MVLVGYIGYRTDTGSVVQALLYEKGEHPAVQLWAGKGEERVRVLGSNCFELKTPDHPDLTGEVERELTKALCVLYRAGLTPAQREALATEVPDLTLR